MVAMAELIGNKSTHYFLYPKSLLYSSYHSYFFQNRTIMSDIELTRVDYTIVGVTNSNCLQLFPGNLPKEQQKVAVADVDGILQVFSIKKEDIQLQFKTLPGPPITSVKVAGASSTTADKLFIVNGNEVKGYTKKGKLFLTFDSGMTETINTMYVLGNELFLCGKHIYTHYRDCKEIGSYLCGDRIIDVIAFYCQNSRRLMSLIACEGRMIRALEHARVTLSMEVESSPTVLHLYSDEDTTSILFGTNDGRVGILDVENSKGFQRWIIKDDQNSSSICTIDSYDINGNGRKQLIIGRQDGNIEVYQVNLTDEREDSRLIFTYNCNESVTSLQCGIVGVHGFDEIVVATYTGRIFGLTTRTLDGNLDNSTGSYISTADTSQKIFKLKADIEELKTKIIKERERYKQATISFSSEVSAIPLLMVKDSFLLDNITSTYNLSMEVPTAIDNILLQCDTEVKLIDVNKNSAVISYSDTNKQDNFLLATYRCQINTNSLKMKISTKEGRKGTLQAYVTPLVQPKCSKVMRYEIKALSLHYRLHHFDNNRPFNVLTIKGSFSLAEIHSWIGQCLPEVPEKVTVSEKTELWFGSTLLNTILGCIYQKGEAEFKSDNVTTISILKDNLTSEATKKKIKVDIKIQINDESINFVLKMIEDKLQVYQKLANDSILLNALEELEVTNEETTKYLSEKYKNLLNSTKEIRKQIDSDPHCLQRYYEAIEDLYISYNISKGYYHRQGDSKLKKLFDNYNYDDIILFFRPAKIPSS